MADNNNPARAAPAARDNPLGSLARGRHAIELIGDGRCSQTPSYRSIEVHTAECKLDVLAAVLKALMLPIYAHWGQFTMNYRGTFAEVQTDVENDVNATVDYAMRGLYNRLRATAEDHDPTALANRMTSRAPFNARDVFPAALARIINSIGYLTIPDGPVHLRVIYAPTPGFAANYGRQAATPFLAQRYRRFVDALQSVNATLNTIDMTPTAGSFWPTCHAEIDADEGYNVRATFHPSHYTNEDAFTGLLLAGNLRIFSDLSFHAEEFTNAAICTALTADVPVGVTAGANANAIRYTHAHFGTNKYGVVPPTAENTAGSVWILGRGAIPIYTVILLRNIDAVDHDAIFREAFRS